MRRARAAFCKRCNHVPSRRCPANMERLRQISARELSAGRTMSNGGCPRTPRAWNFLAIGLLSASLASLPACRLDMQVQPRENPLSRSDFYADQRSERPPVEGTVARGELHEDAYFYTGKLGNNPGDYMPFPVSKEVLERGRERYNIYCTP